MDLEPVLNLANTDPMLERIFASWIGLGAELGSHHAPRDSLILIPSKFLLIPGNSRMAKFG